MLIFESGIEVKDCAILGEAGPAAVTNTVDGFDVVVRTLCGVIVGVIRAEKVKCVDSSTTHKAVSGLPPVLLSLCGSVSTITDCE